MWLKNLSLKLTALGLAILLWFHVATNRTYDYPIQLRLEPGPLPAAYVLASPLPEKARLLISGSGKELVRLLWDDGSAQLLLEPSMAGPITLMPDRLLLLVGADVKIKQVIEPATLQVDVDTVVSRLYPVRFQGEYTISPGFALVEPPRPVPESVSVQGPARFVAELAAVGTRPLDIPVIAATSDFVVATDLADRLKLRADPDSVTIHFEVARSVESEIPGVVVRVPPGWRTEPPEVRVRVAAAAARLAALGPRGGLTADVSRAELESGASAKVSIQSPALVEVVEIIPAHVQVLKR